MSRSRRRRTPDRPAVAVAAPPSGQTATRAARRRAREAPPRSNGSGRWLLVAGLFVILAAGAALLIRGVGSSGTATASAGPASTANIGGGAGPLTSLVSGTSLPTYDAATADAAVGQAIPTITGTDRTGNALAIRPGDGKAKILLFLTHWCSHCQAEVPRVQGWLNGGGSTGDVDLYAISTEADATRPNFPPETWLDREGWTVPTVVDDANSSIAQAFGLSAFPYWVFVDADGTVAGRAAGELSIADIEGIVGRLAE
ncbi:MAG TPA: TlpA disulfide reductase family protein [Candidatus Limnocylindrales bacterium]